jgi:hypothetical protein
MLKFRIFFFPVFLFGFLIHAEPELKGTPNELNYYLSKSEKTVEVMGASELKVSADNAIITLKVTTEDKSFQQSLNKNQNLRLEIIKKLNDKGITADRIKSSKFTAIPEQGFFSDKVKNYKLDNAVKITVVSEKEYEAVTSVVDGFAQVSLVNTQFIRTDKKEMEKKVLAQACADALSKKKLYEEGLGIKLKIVKFSERPVYENPITLMKSRKIKERSLEEEEPSVINFDEITYSAGVSIICEIGNKP